MNNLSEYAHDSLAVTNNSDLLKKLPWSLAFAVIPFIPEILETIKSIPEKVTKNGYALLCKAW